MPRINEQAEMIIAREQGLKVGDRIRHPGGYNPVNTCTIVGTYMVGDVPVVEYTPDGRPAAAIFTINAARCKKGLEQ